MSDERSWDIVHQRTGRGHIVGAEAFDGQDERRMHVQAYRYWQTRLEGRAMPRLDDCPDIWAAPFAARLAVIDLARDGREARIRAISDPLMAEIDPCRTATRELFVNLLSRLPLVALTGGPLGFEADAPALASADADFAFRGILLPLADETGTLAHAMAVMNWRPGAEEDATLDFFSFGTDEPDLPHRSV